MVYEVMTGMINLEELEVQANEVTEISTGGRNTKNSTCCYIVHENK